MADTRQQLPGNRQRGPRARGLALNSPALSRLLALSLLALALSGCMLVAGREQTLRVDEQRGELRVGFVSAEGSDERLLEAGAPGTLDVLASARVERGDLRLEVLRPDGTLALRVVANADGSLVGTGMVSTDEQGRLRYRVYARNARDGSYGLTFERR